MLKNSIHNNMQYYEIYYNYQNTHRIHFGSFQIFSQFGNIRTELYIRRDEEIIGQEVKKHRKTRKLHKKALSLRRLYELWANSNH